MANTQICLKYRAVITEVRIIVKMKIKHDLTFLIKGLHEIRQISPKYLIHYISSIFFQTIRPYVNLYLSSRIINGIIKQESLYDLMALAFLTVVANFLIEIAVVVFNHKVNVSKKYFVERYHMRMSMKMVCMPYATLENPETHRLKQKVIETSNLTGGILGLPEQMQGLIGYLFDVVFSVSLTISLFYANFVSDTLFLQFLSSPWFSLIVSAFIVLNVALGIISKTVLTRKTQSVFNDAADFNRVYDYYIGTYLLDYKNGKDIRIYNQEEVIKGEYLSLFKEVNKLIEKISRSQLFLSTITTITSVLLNFIIYMYIGLKALLGAFGVGNIVQYIGSITRFSTGLSGIMTKIVTLRENTYALETYFQFMELTDEEITCFNKETKEFSKIHSIEFENVSFAYPGTNQNVLQDISIRLEGGQKIAIVGANGSGKTTLIKLLCRLYTPTKGKIKINGTDIQKYSKASYSQLLAVTFQDFKLLSFKLGQNVSSGAEYDEDIVINTLETVGFGERLKEMCYGLETCLNRDFDAEGVELSGGEEQKVALARALYKDTPLIILDEPTSALDPIAEYEIYSKFNQIASNRTVIYISHRLSSCRFCDKILVFDSGKVIQCGSHQELVQNKKGKYYELWNAQAQYYK